MNRERINLLLPNLNSKINPNQNRDGWVIASCPFAPWRHTGGADKNPSFGVKVDESGLSHFHCFSCSSHGDMMDLVLDVSEELKLGDVEGYDIKAALEIVSNEADDLDFCDGIPDYGEQAVNVPKTIRWPESYNLGFTPAIDYDEAIFYLEDRSVSLDLMVALDIRYDVQMKRVVFPLRDQQGRLVGMHGRDITGEAPYPYHVYKYNGTSNKLPWLGESWVDETKPVVLVESVFDLASVYRIYRNVMCSLSCGIGKDKAERIGVCDDVITLYDYGQGGDSARKALDKYLYGSVVHKVPTEQQNDPGQMTIDELKACLGDHIVFDDLIL